MSRRSPAGRLPLPAPPSPPPLLPLLLLLAAAVPPSLAGEPCAPAGPGRGSPESRGPGRPPGPAPRPPPLRALPPARRLDRVDRRRVAGFWGPRRAALRRGGLTRLAPAPPSLRDGPGKGRGCASANSRSAGGDCWRRGQCAPARLAACGASTGPKSAARGRLNIFIHIIEV